MRHSFSKIGAISFPGFWKTLRISRNLARDFPRTIYIQCQLIAVHKLGTGQFILRPFFLRQVTAWGLGLGPGLVFWLGLGWEKISWGEKSHTQFHAPNPQLWLIPHTSNTALFSSHTFFRLFRGGRDSRKKLIKGGTKLEVFNLTCQGRYRPCVGGTRVLFTGLVDACWQVLLPSWKRAVCLTNVTCLTSLQLNEFFFSVWDWDFLDDIYLLIYYQIWRWIL